MDIIINCDDLGASAEVNESIFSLMERGRVTSASLLMNAPAADEAVRRMRHLPHCSFGVHLNVTEFAPLSGHVGLRPLLDERGEFAGKSSDHPMNLPLTASICSGVYAEWSAQVARALDMGVPVSHLDSHHHVHTRAALLPTLHKVKQRFGIRRVRLRRNVLGARRPLRRRLHMAKQFPWNFAVRHLMHSITTDGFTNFAMFYERLQAGFGWNGSIELMCHPGHADYQAETDLLCGPWKEQYARDARLISYNELAPAARPITR